MPYHLLTVDHCHLSGTTAYLAPAVRLHRLIADGPPGSAKPMPGDIIELRLPGGTVRQASIAVFGIDGWTGTDGTFYTASNPADPELTLSLTGIGAQDVPPGTEVWLPGQDAPSTGTGEVNCSWCQMARFRAHGGPAGPGGTGQ